MSITDFLVGAFAPGIIIQGIQRQDPEKLAELNADTVDALLDAEFKTKKSEKIQKVIVPFVERWCKRFCERLLEDQED